MPLPPQPLFPDLLGPPPPYPQFRGYGAQQPTALTNQPEEPTTQPNHSQQPTTQSVSQGQKGQKKPASRPTTGSLRPTRTSSKPVTALPAKPELVEKLPDEGPNDYQKRLKALQYSDSYTWAMVRIEFLHLSKDENESVDKYVRRLKSHNWSHVDTMAMVYASYRQNNT